MRPRKLAAAACVALGLTVAGARAELHINTANVNDPTIGLPPDQWVGMVENIVNAKPIIGQPEVYMINATGQELVVNCDRWSLVGNHPYNDGNPTGLPPWSVTLVNVKGFDGYCTKGVIAQSSTGAVYNGALRSMDGSFSNATFISFTPADKR